MFTYRCGAKKFYIASHIVWVRVSEGFLEGTAAVNALNASQATTVSVCLRLCVCLTCQANCPSSNTFQTTNLAPNVESLFHPIFLSSTYVQAPTKPVVLAKP